MVGSWRSFVGSDRVEIRLRLVTQDSQVADRPGYLSLFSDLDTDHLKPR